MTDDSDQSETRKRRGSARAATGRARRACDYDVTAPHGWEFLLDNLLETEGDDWVREVRHMVVLGEN